MRDGVKAGKPQVGFRAAARPSGMQQRLWQRLGQLAY
jgi:hypothetical protein